MFFEADLALNLIGLLGVVFYLGAYGALMAGLIRGSSYAYAMLNMAAASLVLVSLSGQFNLASAMIQISFIAISIGGIIRLYLANRRVRFNLEEQELRHALFPDLRAEHVRHFFDMGAWVDGQAGMVLTTEGEPVETLYYLTHGKAAARSQGKLLGEIEKGFVGEIGAIEKRPATASVSLTRPSRLFAMSGHSLRKLRAMRPDLRNALDARMSEDTGRKLVAANTRLRMGGGG